MSACLRLILLGLSLAVISLDAPGASAQATFKEADKKDKPKDCPDGAFLDLRLDDWSVGAQCWSCPKGYTRTLDPVTATTACFKESGTDYKEADFKHKWLCDGEKREFFDPRKGGECWKCPANRPRRTAYAVTSDKACATTHIIGESLTDATYVRKVKTCKDGAFFDPRKGGECWKCPSGYGRTVTFPVNGKKACAKETPDSHASAKLENQLGCPRGQFFDPRNGGECWKCPASHPHRTTAAVTSDKACTDNLLGILPVESQTACRDLVAVLGRSLDDGAKMKGAIEHLTKPILDPVIGTLQGELSKMTELVGDLEPLQVHVQKLGGPVLRRVEALADRFPDTNTIRKTLLHPSICTEGPRALEQRLGTLFQPQGGGFLAVTVGVTFTHSIYKATAQLGLTIITDFDGKGGLFASGKIGATSSEDPFSVSVSAMFFPQAGLDDFGLSPIPAITASVAKGNAFNQLFEKFPKLLTATRVIDGVDISWSPAAPNKLPTFGVAKSLYTKEGTIPTLVDFSATAGWDFPIITWANHKLR